MYKHPEVQKPKYGIISYIPQRKLTGNKLKLYHESIAAGWQYMYINVYYICVDVV